MTGPGGGSAEQGGPARRGASPGRGRAGRRVSPAERHEARAAVEDVDVVMAAAARFLEGRARSVEEVRRRLTGAGYRAELVAEVIERLGRLGILDDEAFARAWVESRDRARPRGSRLLQGELRQKGIDPDLIAAVVAERCAPAADRREPPAERPEPPADLTAGADPDAAGADRLLARHAAALRRVADPRKRRQRAYALLARNGFDPETAGAAVRRAEQERGVLGSSEAPADADGEPGEG